MPPTPPKPIVGCFTLVAETGEFNESSAFGRSEELAVDVAKGEEDEDEKKDVAAAPLAAVDLSSPTGLTEPKSLTVYIPHQACA